MRPYAERPVRALLQLVADVAVVVWVVLVVQFALAARAMLLELQGPGRALTDAGTSVRDTFANAAETAGGIPFVGEALADALGSGTSAGESLIGAGADVLTSVETGAMWTAVVVVGVGAVPIVLLWLFVRIRWMRAAHSARIVRRVDTDLLALRAITRLPVRKLLAVSPDPASAWRHDDRAVVRDLAALELRSLGLRVPPTAPD